MEGEHAHCDSCFNLNCTVTPQPGTSCDLVSCPLQCGAVFHSCKAEEHHLLCPLMRVPCLNRDYGCPANLVRNQMHAHLDVCPAGVVCCTMEWNRWPVSCLDYNSSECLSHGVEEVEQLDIALALEDQRTLIESLKMITVAPTAPSTSLIPGAQEDAVMDSAFHTSVTQDSTCIESSSPHHQEPTPVKSAKEKIASGINGLNEEPLSKLYQATAETARSLVAALEVVSGASSPGFVNRGPVVEEITASSTNNGDLYTLEATEGVCSSCLNVNGVQKEPDVQILTNANGPLSGGTESCLRSTCTVKVQDNRNGGVSQEPQTWDMNPPLCVIPGGAQRAGHVVLEDRGVVLLENHELKVHSSPHQGHYSLAKGQMGVIRERSVRGQQREMEDKAVDTSDLEQHVDPLGLGEINLTIAALLFSLEESRECRRISDTAYVDSYHVDFGTQTFTYPAIILVTNTRVGDMASASACDHAALQLSYPSPFHTLRLGLVLQALGVNAIPDNRYLPPNPRHQHMFPFVCGQSFRRDQFSAHFTNVHSDIHAGLNGWMEHRCPLAYYGCSFSQRRFHPSTKGAKVVYDRHLRSFGVQSHPKAKLPGISQLDHFNGLPIEIYLHIASFLDSFSLCQLSLVSRTMREVCASLLQTRGIVEVQWKQSLCPGPNGTVSWQMKNKVWKFSTAFNPVLSWGFTDHPSMSDHLKKCTFNVVEHKTDPVPLPAMCTTRDGQSLRYCLRHVDI